MKKNNKNNNTIIEGKKSMSILKKISLGAVIILAVLLVMPGKAWAADETLTVSVESTKISFSGTGFEPGTEYYFVPSKDGTPTTDKIDCTADVDGKFSESITSTPLEFFGNDRKLKVSGEIFKKTGGEKVTTVDVTPATAYLGKITVPTDVTSDNADGYILTSDENAFYGTTFTTSKPKYIKTIKQNGTSKETPNSKEYTLPEYIKVKDGDISVESDIVVATLSPDPTLKTFTKNGYTGELVVTPNIYVASAEMRDEDFTDKSADFALNLKNYSGTGNTIKLIPDPAKTNAGTAKGKIKIYVGDSLEDDTPSLVETYEGISINLTGAYPATSYRIDITKPGTTYKTGSTSDSFSATITEITDGVAKPASNQYITWTISPTSGATLSRTTTASSTDTLTVTGTSAGTYTVTATAKNYMNNSSPVTANFEIVFSDSEYSIDGPMYLLVGDEFGDNNASASPGTGTIYEIKPIPSSGTTVTWETSAPALVEIDSVGKINILKKPSGNFNFTITAKVGSEKIKKEVILVSIGYKTKAISVSSGSSNKIYLDMRKGYNTNISNSSTTITGFDVDDPSVEIKNSQLYVLNEETEGDIDVTTYLKFPDGSTGKYTDEMVYYPRVEITDTDTDECTIEAEIPNAAYSGYNDGNNIAEGAVVGYNVQLIYNNKAYASKSYFPKNFDLYYNTAEIDSDKLHEIIQLSSEDLAKDNVTGSKIDVSFRVSPCTKNKVNTKVGSISDEITAYRVSVSGDHITTNSVYGLEGHKVQLTATPNTGYELTGWSDSSSTTEKTRTFTVKTSGNAYTATTKTSGSSNGSTSGNGTTPNKTGNSNLDKVPKTGESMAIYWVIMVAIISASVVAAVLYKYFTPKVRKWRGGDTDGNDNCAGR